MVPTQSDKTELQYANAVQYISFQFVLWSVQTNSVQFISLSTVRQRPKTHLLPNLFFWLFPGLDFTKPLSSGPSSSLYYLGHFNNPALIDWLTDIVSSVRAFILTESQLVYGQYTTTANKNVAKAYGKVHMKSATQHGLESDSFWNGLASIASVKGNNVRNLYTVINMTNMTTLHCLPATRHRWTRPPSRPVLDLPTPEGWKAELTLVVGYILRWFTCPQTVTHPSTNHLIVTRSGVEEEEEDIYLAQTV